MQSMTILAHCFCSTECVRVLGVVGMKSDGLENVYIPVDGNGFEIGEVMTLVCEADGCHWMCKKTQCE